MPKMNGFVLYERLKTVEPELMIRLDGSFGGVIWMRIMDSLGISSIYTKSERNSKTEAGQKYLDGYCSLVNIDSLSNWDCHNHFNHRFWYNHNLHAEKDK